MKMKFPMPKGFQAPADTKENEEFDAVATLRLEDGQLCLVAIDGAEVGEYKEKDEMEEPDEEEEDFASAMMRGLSAKK